MRESKEIKRRKIGKFWWKQIHLMSPPSLLSKKVLFLSLSFSFSPHPIIRTINLLTHFHDELNRTIKPYFWRQVTDQGSDQLREREMGRVLKKTGRERERVSKEEGIKKEKEGQRMISPSVFFLPLISESYDIVRGGVMSFKRKKEREKRGKRKEKKGETGRDRWPSGQYPISFGKILSPFSHTHSLSLSQSFGSEKVVVKLGSK